MTSECLSQLSSVIDFVRYAVSEMTRAKVFFGHGYDNAWDEALMLVEHAIDCDLNHSSELLQARLLDAEKKSILTGLSLRTHQRLPLAYIIQQAYFAGLPFYVDKRVLVPRSPIAELILQQFSPWLDVDHGHKPLQVLELCTGSGCIAIATACHLPMATVVASDISPQALAVACHNATKLDVDDRVQCIESDLFDCIPQQSFDLIIANPPYVSQSTIDCLPPEYLHEPRLGLHADEGGTAMAIQILQQAADYLSLDGLLVMEVGDSQSVLVERLPKVPFTWLDFENGGKGIFVLNRAQLVENFELGER